MLSMRKNLLNARYSGKKIYNIVAALSNETKLRNFMKRFKIQKNFSNYYYVLSIGTKSLLPIFCLLLTSGYCIRTYKFACKTKEIKWIQILFFSCTINCFLKTLFVLLLKKIDMHWRPHIILPGLLYLFFQYFILFFLYRCFSQTRCSAQKSGSDKNIMRTHLNK